MRRYLLSLALLQASMGSFAQTSGYAHLGPDGKLLSSERPASSGGIAGSATAGQVTYGTSTDVVTGSPYFIYDPAFSHLTITGDGTDLILQSTGSTVGPQISLNHTGYGGSDWRMESAGAADIGGSGAYLIYNYSTGVRPLFLDGPTGNIGLFNQLAPTAPIHVKRGSGAGGDISDSNALVKLESDTNSTDVWLNTKSSLSGGTSATIGFATAGVPMAALTYNTTHNYVALTANAASADPDTGIFVKTAGYVGVNNHSPTEQLDVNGNIKSSGMAAIGNAASVGIASGAQRYVDIENNITDAFNAASSYRNITSRLVINPTTNSTATANGLSSQVVLDAASATAFHALVGASTFTQHQGSGTVDIVNGLGIVASTAGTGQANLLQGLSIDAYNNGANTTPSNVGLSVQVGSGNASGSVTDARALTIKTPHTTGTVGANTGIYVEDQSTGGEGRALYLAGGKVYSAGPLGLGAATNPTLPLEITGTSGVLAQLKAQTGSTQGTAIRFDNTTEAGGISYVVGEPGTSLGGTGNWAVFDETNDAPRLSIAGNTGDITAYSNTEIRGRILGHMTPNPIAAASTLVLGNGNTNLISGTGTVDFISTTGWTSGSEVTLICQGASVWDNNTITPPAGTAPLLLSGSANFTCADNVVLKFVLVGSVWHEESRTIP